MILQPWKSPEEIDRRLAELNDPELAKLLRAANGDLFTPGDLDHLSEETPPPAPYWKTRIGLLALSGLIALLTGYASVTSFAHHRTQPAAHPRTAVAAVHHHAAKLAPIVPKHHAAAATRHVSYAAPVAPIAPRHLTPRAAPPDPQVAQIRAQLAHERAMAEQARLDAQRAQHQAEIALQTQAQAKARGQEELQDALARARAQARAQAVAQAQAQAAQERADAAYENAPRGGWDGTKPGVVPPDYGQVPTFPNGGGAPVPAPMPPGGSCTPSRAQFLTSALTHVRVGGTNLGTVMRLIHP